MISSVALVADERPLAATESTSSASASTSTSTTNEAVVNAEPPAPAEPPSPAYAVAASASSVIAGPSTARWRPVTSALSTVAMLADSAW